MSIWLQDIIIFLAVAACIAYILMQLKGTFAGKHGKIGSCCAKGCPPPGQTRAPARARGGASAEIFLPVEDLVRRRQTKR